MINGSVIYIYPHGYPFSDIPHWAFPGCNHPKFPRKGSGRAPGARARAEREAVITLRLRASRWEASGPRDLAVAGEREKVPRQRPARTDAAAELPLGSPKWPRRKEEAGTATHPRRRAATDAASECQANIFAWPNGEEENKRSAVNNCRPSAGSGPTRCAKSEAVINSNSTVRVHTNNRTVYSSLAQPSARFTARCQSRNSLSACSAGMTGPNVRSSFHIFCSSPIFSQ